jgi:predicted ATPase
VKTFFQDSKCFFKNPNISSNPDPNFSFRNAADRSEITCQNFSGIYKNHTQPYTTRREKRRERERGGREKEERERKRRERKRRKRERGGERGREKEEERGREKEEEREKREEREEREKEEKKRLLSFPSSLTPLWSPSFFSLSLSLSC